MKYQFRIEEKKVVWEFTDIAIEAPTVEDATKIATELAEKGNPFNCDELDLPDIEQISFFVDLENAESIDPDQGLPTVQIFTKNGELIATNV